jgi:protein-disulfide isomerase
MVGLVVLLVLVVRPGSPSSHPTGSLAVPVAAIPAGLANDRTLGRADAPVTLDIWTDFQCPFCAEFDQQIQPRLVTDFVVPGTVRLVAHDLSFIGSGHTPDESTDAAVGARCAGQQGRFWEYHGYVYANQGKENSGTFTQERLLAIADAVGLDRAAYQACVADPTVRASVATETSQGFAQRISTTPTVLIDGKPFASVLSYVELGAAIRTEAAAVGSGAPVSPAGSGASAAP